MVISDQNAAKHNECKFIRWWMCVCIVHCKCLNGDEWWNDFNNSIKSLQFFFSYFFFSFECKYHITSSIVLEFEVDRRHAKHIEALWTLNTSFCNIPSDYHFFHNHQIHFSSIFFFLFAWEWDREKKRIMCPTFYATFFSIESAGVVVHHPLLHFFHSFLIFLHYFH